MPKKYRQFILAGAVVLIGGTVAVLVAKERGASMPSGNTLPAVTSPAVLPPTVGPEGNPGKRGGPNEVPSEGRPTSREVLALTSDSITVEVDGVNYQIFVAGGTVVQNADGSPITFLDIRQGDSVQLSIIDFNASKRQASWIRDLSR